QFLVFVKIKIIGIKLKINSNYHFNSKNTNTFGFIRNHVTLNAYLSHNLDNSVFDQVIMIIAN
ncbi:hypothetical protein BpHYR1_009141, partial [Brachionus plicatilis]